MKPSSTSREAGETTRFFEKVELSYCGFIHRYQHRIGALPKMAAV
jgi:hypothetical protein